MLDLIIKNGECYINGNLEKKDIGISNNKIVEIGDLKDESKETFDAKGLTVLPGCIDTQVHFREPGSTDTENLNSGSKAAVMGGITSVFEMPNIFKFFLLSKLISGLNKRMKSESAKLFSI